MKRSPSGFLRYTDPLPLRELPPELLDLLDDMAEPGSWLEELLALRPRPHALVVLALDVAGACGAVVVTQDGDLITENQIGHPHAALHGEEMRRRAVAWAKERWKDTGWALKTSEATRAA